MPRSTDDITESCAAIMRLLHVLTGADGNEAIALLIMCLCPLGRAHGMTGEDLASCVADGFAKMELALNQGKVPH